MLKFYYNTKYKYTNRSIIDITGDTNYTEKDYENIDTPDTINGHIIYEITPPETLPTYITEEYDENTTRRWFVSGITQLRTGKYQISLLRDIISENPDAWKDEEAYISAGTADNYNKYKKWNLPFTNTKIGEQRLNINGKSSFFVYYVNTQSIDGDLMSESDLKIKSASIPGYTGFDFQVANLNEIPNYNLIGSNLTTWIASKGTANVRMYDGTTIKRGDLRVYHVTYNSQASTDFSVGSIIISDNWLRVNTLKSMVDQNFNNCKTNMRTAYINFLNNHQNSIATNTPVSSLTALDTYVGKIIHNTTDNKVYRINKGQSQYSYNRFLTNSQTGTLWTALSNIGYYPIIGEADNFKQNNSWFRFESTALYTKYTLEELGVATSFDFNFTKDVRKLPKSAVRCVNIVSGGGITDDDIAQSLMLAQTNGINETGDTGRILDIQYLPFSIATNTNANIKINTSSLYAKFLDTDDYVFTSSMTALPYINKETTTCKIVSPTRASQFLFNPYNNDGNTSFNIKITLKPYSSIIYIRPSTTGLLIYDWDDKDCLVIYEDFSLTNVSSAWANYIYNNKNYQNIFERELQGREFERGWERQIENAQKKADEWTARNISATKASTYTGNIPIVSGIAGAIGTAWKDQEYLNMASLDRQYNEAMYQESRAIATETFAYQLDNVKSQPLIPSKITAIDIKMLDGVYIEIYDTNASEQEAIRLYYKYNGNRIDAYGTFQQYYGPFIRGKIIKSKYYTQPELSELNRRLELGVFTEEVTP